MKRRYLAVLAAVGTAAVIGLAGCSGTGQSAPAATSGGKQLNIAVVTHGPNGDPFWSLVKSGAEQAGKDLNVKVSYQSNSDPVQQSNLIDSAVAQHVSGIVVSMADPAGLKAAMARATAAHIPMVAINAGGNDAIAQGALTFVGQDPVPAADAAGKRLVDAGYKHAVCVQQEAGNAYLETTCSELAKTAGLTVTQMQVNGTNLADVQSTIQSKLLQDPSIDAVFTLNTDIGEAAVKAVAAAGSKATVTAYNLDPQTLNLIKSGKELFTVDQQGFLQGYQATQILDEYLRYGLQLGGGQEILTGPTFVTKDNVDQIAKFVKQGTR